MPTVPPLPSTSDVEQDRAPEDLPGIARSSFSGRSRWTWTEDPVAAISQPAGLSALSHSRVAVALPRCTVTLPRRPRALERSLLLSRPLLPSAGPSSPRPLAPPRAATPRNTETGSGGLDCPAGEPCSLGRESRSQGTASPHPPSLLSSPRLASLVSSRLATSARERLVYRSLAFVLIISNGAAARERSVITLFGGTAVCVARIGLIMNIIRKNGDINRAYVYMCQFFRKQYLSMRYHVCLLCCDNFLFFLIDTHTHTERYYDVISILFVVNFILINFLHFFFFLIIYNPFLRFRPLSR